MKKAPIYLLIFVALFLQACGGGGSGNSDPDASSAELNGRAILGPISNAKVYVYCQNDLSEPIASIKTTSFDGQNYDKTGMFTVKVPETCSYYTLEIDGGEDIDYDDNGIADTKSVKNNGKFRALVFNTNPGNNVSVNAISEISYQALKANGKLSSDSTNVSSLKNNLNTLAETMINQDINGDNKIDYNDILSFNPLEDKYMFQDKNGYGYNSLLPDNDNNTNTLIERIHQGNLTGNYVKQIIDTNILITQNDNSTNTGTTTASFDINNCNSSGCHPFIGTQAKFESMVNYPRSSCSNCHSSTSVTNMFNTYGSTNTGSGSNTGTNTDNSTNTGTTTASFDINNCNTSGCHPFIGTQAQFESMVDYQISSCGNCHNQSTVDSIFNTYGGSNTGTGTGSGTTLSFDPNSCDGSDCHNLSTVESMASYSINTCGECHDQEEAAEMLNKYANKNL